MSERRDRLGVTFRRYAEEIAQRLGLLRRALAGGDLPGLLLQAHSLAGSGASVGAEPISAAARPIERAVLAIQAENRAATAGELAALARQADILAAEVAAFDPEQALDRFLSEAFPNG